MLRALITYRFSQSTYLFLTFCLLTIWSLVSIAQTTSDDNQLSSVLALEKQIEASQEHSEEQKTLAREQIESIKTLLLDTAQLQRKAKSLEEQAQNASTKILDINTAIRQLNASQVSIDVSKPIDVLENQLLLLTAEQKTLYSQAQQKQETQTMLATRANDIAQELSGILSTENQLEQEVENQSYSALGLIERVEFLKKQALLKKLQASTTSLKQEIATIPSRQAIVAAQIQEINASTDLNQRRLEKLNTFLTASRKDEVEQLVAESQQALNKLGDNHRLASMAQENVLLAKLYANIQATRSTNKTTITGLREQLVEVQRSAETVEQVLATGRVTDELGELLRKLRAQLPDEESIEARKATIEENAIRQQLDVILWQERLRNLSDTSSSALRLAVGEEAFKKLNVQDTLSKQSALGKQNAPAIQQSTLSQQDMSLAQNFVIERRQILADLVGAANARADEIVEEKLVINQLLAASSELRELLDRRLIWLPSNSGKAGNLGINLTQSAVWFLSPYNWAQVLESIYVGAISSPLIPMILASFVVLILRFRQRIKTNLWALVEQVGNVKHDTFFTTPLALFWTLVLAIPIPISLFALATLMFNGATTNTFSSAIATGIASVSSLSLVLLFFRSMCREGSLFDKHFDWSIQARKKLRTMLTWFIWVQCLSSFIFVSAIASGESELRYGIAIVAFIFGSLGISVFAYQFFQPTKGVSSNIVGGTKAGIVTVIAFPFVVLSPLAIGSLPLFGFFDTSVELQSKLFLSGIVLVLAAIFYGIVLRIFLVAFRRYLVKRKRLEAIAAQNESKQNEHNELKPAQEPTDKKELNEEDIVNQSRSIILWTTRILFAACLWLVWKPLLPALGIVEDIVLWQEITMVDGVALSSGVTLWNIILSVLFIVGGVVAAKNIRGVMEIGFFERFEMDNGSRYATITILSYVLVGSGIVFGFAQLGIDWSKLQWIVAALGVGLGFGLQEIVANFVSGLIILFERPIRVGDFVTIGNLSGTVSNIKIRATTVTDFDNREVLLPNKSIITENVTNWTLRDGVTRIIVKIGVAYGSDIKQVHALLMDEVTKHPHVLETPPPMVLFLEHGDSSLNFEIRAFVSRPEDRLPLVHDINLAVNSTLAAHDIAIPFPQRDLHIVSGELPIKYDKSSA